MTKMRINVFTIALLYSIIGISCKKEFLDEKPSTSIVQPTTLEEFYSLLDNYDVNNVTAGLSILSADEYVYYSDEIWKSARTATQRNAYVWAKDLYEGEISDDWNKPFTTIFYANNVLKGLEHIKPNSFTKLQFDNIKGWALFVRSFANYELVSNFAPVYDQSTASKDLGIPNKLAPSIDQISPRATVQENFNQILSDLESATQLLEGTIPANRNKPSKIAAHALSARIFLSMRDYDKAEKHADSCLTIYDKLIDYKTLSKTSSTPFSLTNVELIYSKYAAIKASYAAGNNYIKIAPEFINLYPPNDLRLSLFFNKQTDGSFRTKRAYHGNGQYPFVGLATDEVYLIKAECLARKGAISEAMNLLNKLLVNRWDPNATNPSVPFQKLIASNTDDAIEKVLFERKRELIWRGLRWDDLKRLNKEGRNIRIVRQLNGVEYILESNSPKYIFPIPDNEIGLGGIQQNNR